MVPSWTVLKMYLYFITHAPYRTCKVADIVFNREKNPESLQKYKHFVSCKIRNYFASCAVMICGMTHVSNFSKMINIAWQKNNIFVIYT